jgi:hypothetical protein
MMRRSFLQRGLLGLATIGLASAIWWSCNRHAVSNLPDEVAQELAKLPDDLSYTYAVKPILSDRCFACHGPDAAKQQAGLRLDVAASAYEHESEETGRYAIKPGNPDASDVVQRILSTDPKLVMPTPESHLSLTSREKAVLIKWIEEGAKYEPHWAFTVPKKPALPAVKNGAWVRNDIDRFVLAKLETQGLKPAPEADRTTLLRRVSMDLTGLPPTPEEVEAFERDRSPNAYERAVERLLASVHYGEHQAAAWLDVARYADTHGYQDDGLRTMWPYRDWVIRAFNQNLPYDQFVTWQLAGDLLPNPTKDQLIATAFNRNHQQSQEGGIVPEEYHVEYVADRVNTFGKAFLAHTTECARCHDHKYDPISQKDYFSLYAFFNTVNEYGQIPYNGEPSPHLTVARPETEAKLKGVRAQLARLDQQQRQDEAAARQRFAAWLAGVRTNPTAAVVPLAKDQLAHVPFDTLSVRPWTREVEIKPSSEELKKNPKAKPRKETRTGTEYRFRNAAADSMPMYVQGDLEFMPKMVKTPRGHGVYLPGESFLQLRSVGWNGKRFPDRNSGWFDRHEPFTVGLWVNIRDPKLAGPLLNRNLGPFNGFRGYQVERLPDGRLAFKLSYVWPDDAIDVETEQAVPLKSWTHIAMTYDGSSRAGGLKIYLNGRPAKVRVMADNLTQSIVYGKDSTHWGGGVPNVGVGQLHDRNYKGFAVDELTIHQRKLTALEVSQLAGSRSSILSELRSEHNREALFDYYLTHFDAATRARVAQRQALVAQESALLLHEPDVMVMHEQRYPRKSYLLKRGAYDAPGEEVSADVPGVMSAFPDDLPRNRLGLARWLLRAENPLLARVVVNRFWQAHFGTGLVKTTDDFGNQGELPSHPELLDYLAVDFREKGWDVKALLRQIVTSATYRQSSRPTEQLLEMDPDNRLLARGPSYRISAEQVRDNALHASGLLTEKVGGPSVYPYQPAGIWEALATRNAVTYEQHHGDSLYRRSMYTIWKRSSPPPMMLNFDASERAFCTVKRQKTSTPLQALVTLNDPQFVEASRVLAERMIRLGGATPEARITYAYRALTSRSPRPQEVALLKDLYAQEQADFAKNPKRAAALLTVGEYPFDKTLNPTELAANAVVASTIMNFDEFVIKR